MLGGYFNLIRKPEDKSSKNINYTLIDLFTEFIVNNKLMEIKRGSSRFTWTNKQKCPIMVDLDKILVSTGWEVKFPLRTNNSLTRVGYDHNSIVLDTGEGVITKIGRFYFER